MGQFHSEKDWGDRLRKPIKFGYITVGEHGLLGIETDAERVSMGELVYRVNGNRCGDFEVEAVDERACLIPGIYKGRN